MRFSRTFASLMVLLIVVGTVIVISWAQTTTPPGVQYGTVGGQTITVSPDTGAVQYGTPPGYHPYVGGIGVATAAQDRPWSAEQACGQPNTPTAGDYPTAWASRIPDGEADEWLSLNFNPPVDPVAVLIYENCNPGAISTVNLYDDQKRLLKTLEQPVGPVGESKRNLVLPVGAQLDGKVSRVEIILRSQVVPGWNEIDAVGLIDAEGKTQWAKTATASSTFADMIPTQGIGYGETYTHEARIQRLEQQVAELRGVIDQLQQRLAPQIRPAGGPPRVELKFESSGRPNPTLNVPATVNPYQLKPEPAVRSTTPSVQPIGAPPSVIPAPLPGEGPKSPVAPLPPATTSEALPRTTTQGETSAVTPPATTDDAPAAESEPATTPGPTQEVPVQTEDGVEASTPIEGSIGK